jgi:pimeloyl-ACP methyl ester carboxylesterase
MLWVFKLENNLVTWFVLTVSLGFHAMSFGQQSSIPTMEYQSPVTLTFSDFGSTLQQVESHFASAINQEAACNECCVDIYYQAAIMSWPLMESDLIHSGEMSGRAAQIYQYALQQLIKTGQKYHRFDPRQGLHVNQPGGEAFIPVVYRGFTRKASDFDCLIPENSSGSSELKTIYRCEGLGVTNVVRHRRLPDECFRREQQLFIATMVLRPGEGDRGSVAESFVIEILNPYRVKDTYVAGRPIKIARDLSAAYVYLLENRDKKNPLEAFIHPGGTKAGSELFMLEPYQPGKIPLVFVHGLLSEPFTWANMANELQARPELMERYQIWGFKYGTGEPFLRSAADFREQLVQIQATMDPHGNDPAFSQMVLVGHSMGGLLSKLQITESGDALWRSVSNRPIADIVADEEVKSQLTRLFYFNPSPSVARVIYMGTPHRGSPWARRPIGRFGAKLVEEPSANEEVHQTVVNNNPNTFSRELEKRIPTSIDLLRADSGLLLAIDGLCVPEHIKQNSIIGNYRCMIGAGKSDTIVPVSSAIRPGAESELMVHAKHTEIHSQQDAIEETVRILWQHACDHSSTILNSRPGKF